MTRPLIVLGDRTDHGGTVVEASAVTGTHDRRIARVGDKVTCPRKGHGGVTTIVTGDPTFIIDGQAAARHGDKCACGATLLSSQMATVVDDGASTSGSGSTADNGASAAANPTTATTPREAWYDEQATLEPPAVELSGVPWFIETRDGRTFNGRAASDGTLPRIETASPEDYTVYWGDEALQKKMEHDAS